MLLFFIGFTLILKGPEFLNSKCVAFRFACFVYHIFSGLVEVGKVRQVRCLEGRIREGNLRLLALGLPFSFTS